LLPALLVRVFLSCLFVHCATTSIYPITLNLLLHVIFGQLAGIIQALLTGEVTSAEFTHDFNHNTLYLVYLGIAEFFAAYIYTVGFIYTGEYATQKLRKEYVRGTLSQNIAFFDRFGAGEFTNHITADMTMIQTASHTRSAWSSRLP